MILILIQRIL